MLVLAWIWGALHPAADAASGALSGVGDTAGASSGTPTAGGTIAQVSQVPVNNAATFRIPSSGDLGVLVHLSSGQFVAYDAICTHAGCTVEYNPSTKMLLCPCYGAAFDPAQQAAVVQGPTYQPLASVPIHVDDATGVITLSS
jgi:thiosulfate dehydrogenase [quinone] large subunit